MGVELRVSSSFSFLLFGAGGFFTAARESLPRICAFFKRTNSTGRRTQYGGKDQRTNRSFLILPDSFFVRKRQPSLPAFQHLLRYFGRDFERYAFGYAFCNTPSKGFKCSLLRRFDDLTYSGFSGFARRSYKALNKRHRTG